MSIYLMVSEELFKFLYIESVGAKDPLGVVGP